MSASMQHALHSEERGPTRFDGRFHDGRFFVTVGLTRYPADETYTVCATTPEQLHAWRDAICAAVDQAVAAHTAAQQTPLPEIAEVAS